MNWPEGSGVSGPARCRTPSGSESQNWELQSTWNDSSDFSSHSRPCPLEQVLKSLLVCGGTHRIQKKDWFLLTSPGPPSECGSFHFNTLSHQAVPHASPEKLGLERERSCPLQSPIPGCWAQSKAQDIV